jgi:hypothetical protein
MSNAPRVLALVLVACTGCGNPDRYGREPIEGRVLVAGQPVPHANVLFSGENGPTEFDTGALVLNGEYRITREFGLPPGRYRARLSHLVPAPGAMGATVQTPGDEGEVKLRQMIPPPFSTEGVVVEVVAGETNVFDFRVP